LGRPRPKRRLKVTYKVGDIEVVSLYDGVWEKPHDESFIKGANVEETKAAFKAVGLTDAHVPIPFTVIAVNTSGGWILIDCGTGGGQAGGPKAGVLAQSMAAAGIDPKAVKTRGYFPLPWRPHFRPDGERYQRADFPEAEIVVPAAELKWWTQPIDSIPRPRRALAQRIQATLPTWKNVKVVDGEADVAPRCAGNTCTRPHAGSHGPPRQLRGQPVARDGRRHNVAALFVTNPEWQGAFDHVPDQAVETRKKLV
jgi:hypothetical protein